MFSFFKKKKEEEVIENITSTQIEKKKEEIDEEKKSFFSRALEKTFATIKTVVPQKKEKISFDDIQELLIEADMEYEIIEKAMDGLPDEITRKQLRHRLVMLFEHAPKVDLSNLPKPFVRLIIGVNGAGKTTTIAKLANKTKKEGKSVILGAGDTFRAAASEQLSIWAKRTGADIVKHAEGADPAAVAFDAVSAAKARGSDVVLIDTAGRLQTKVNLMEELAKISRVVKKVIPDAPHQTILVLDATTGQNAVSQAQNFGEIVPLTGVVLTKLDGTAKGGVVLSIHEELHVPIRWIGLGEREDDLQRFNALEFAKALFETEDHILSQSTKV